MLQKFLQPPPPPPSNFLQHMGGGGGAQGEYRILQSPPPPPISCSTQGGGGGGGGGQRGQHVAEFLQLPPKFLQHTGGRAQGSTCCKISQPPPPPPPNNFCSTKGRHRGQNVVKFLHPPPAPLYHYDGKKCMFPCIFSIQCLLLPPPPHPPPLHHNGEGSIMCMYSVGTSWDNSAGVRKGHVDVAELPVTAALQERIPPISVDEALVTVCTREREKTIPFQY